MGKPGRYAHRVVDAGIHVNTKDTITNLYYDSEIARFNRPAPTHCSSI
jgi:hypothetical protein